MAFEGLSDRLEAAFKRLRSKGNRLLRLAVGHNVPRPLSPQLFKRVSHVF